MHINELKAKSPQQLLKMAEDMEFDLPIVKLNTYSSVYEDEQAWVNGYLEKVTFASGNTGIYKGKLEALYSAKQFIDNPDYEYVVVCDSTVLCNLNFRPVIMKHIESGIENPD